MAHNPKSTKLYGGGYDYVWTTVCTRCGFLLGEGYYSGPCPADEKPVAKARRELTGEQEHALREALRVLQTRFVGHLTVRKRAIEALDEILRGEVSDDA